MNAVLSSNSAGAAHGALKVLRHSHHYDAALHRAITETGVDRGREILERAAASTAYRAASMAGCDTAEAMIHAVFGTTGLGTLVECSVGEEGGRVVVEPSSFVRARLEMFGKTTQPACDVTRGVLSGAMGAAFGAAYEVEEVSCVAHGGKRCDFRVRSAGEAHAWDEIPVVGWAEVARLDATDPAASLAELAAHFDSEETDAPSYGRLWAELYARAAFDFEREIPESMGAKFANLASVVLTEAAHLGTFYSVGGLVRSKLWQEQVAPGLASREEWARTIVELVNGFGWGQWHVEMLAPEQRFTVHLHHGYESESHLALGDGPASAPRCYFAKGFVAALMNVLFAGDVLGPSALNQKVYNTLFRSPSSFRAVETRCAATSDAFCEFVATPLSPGFLRF